MFGHREVVKQDVVLGAQAQALADASHVLGDLVAADVCLSTGGGKETWTKQKVPQRRENPKYQSRQGLPQSRHLVSLFDSWVTPLPRCPPGWAAGGLLRERDAAMTRVSQLAKDEKPRVSAISNVQPRPQS